jgi:hypothetical protein
MDTQTIHPLINAVWHLRRLLPELRVVSPHSRVIHMSQLARKMHSHEMGSACAVVRDVEIDYARLDEPCH